mgnify:FL=1|tara:strand:+ start:4089 stop:5063 length:975 start_codon:yes stop_codon:yes gene_type:complete
MFKQFIKDKNKKKVLFTPGPASLSEENIKNLAPAFGRGDSEYQSSEKRVLNLLKKMSGKKQIVRMQGSGSFAIEVMIANFLYGKVLIINTGYYSDRLHTISKNCKNYFKYIKKIDTVNWKKLNKVNGNYDWLLCCYTETSRGLKLPIKSLYNLSKKINSKLMIDATASFGLEENHHLANVFSYSSCKGLFGLTGASFISYDKNPSNEIKSFNLSLLSHKEKKMTGPYHSIYSLLQILPKHNDFKQAVKINKKKFIMIAKKYLIYEKNYQPLICTAINKKIYSKKKGVVLYKAREKINGSIINHLGEVHLKRKAKGKILDFLKIK